MNQNPVERHHRVAGLDFILAILFWVFFQVNKAGLFRDINLFAEGSYDAIGSFAVQAALLVGLLSYARALRFRSDPSQAPKARLVLRGNVLVLVAILTTLVSDAIAEVTHRVPVSWGFGFGAILVLAGEAAPWPSLAATPGQAARGR